MEQHDHVLRRRRLGRHLLDDCVALVFGERAGTRELDCDERPVRLLCYAVRQRAKRCSQDHNRSHSSEKPGCHLRLPFGQRCRGVPVSPFIHCPKAVSHHHILARCGLCLSVIFIIEGQASGIRACRRGGETRKRERKKRAGTRR
jgi:hypothetical protein